MRNVEPTEGMHHARKAASEEGEAFDFGPVGRHDNGACGTCPACVEAQGEDPDARRAEEDRKASAKEDRRVSPSQRVKLFRSTEAEVLRALARGQIHHSEVQLEIDHAQRRVIVRYGVALC